MPHRRAHARSGRRRYRARRRQVSGQGRADRGCRPRRDRRPGLQRRVCPTTSTPVWSRPTSSSRPTRPSRSAPTSPSSRSSRRPARSSSMRYVSVDDCGNIISPLLVTGQVHGGLAQGIGQALWEELHYDSQRRTADRHPQRLRHARRRTFSRPSRRTTPPPRPRSTRSAPRASARRPRSARPPPWPTPSSTPSRLGHQPSRHSVHAGEGLAGDQRGRRGRTTEQRIKGLQKRPTLRRTVAPRQ